MTGSTRTELAATWPPTSDVAREAGHKPQSPLRAIRDKCLDCSCYQASEVRLCEAVKCPLWPFRAGKHPWIGRRRKNPPNSDGDFEQQTAFQDEGSGTAELRDADRALGMTVPRLVSRATQHRRTSRLAARFDQALAAMSQGQSLHLQPRTGGPLWSLSDGRLCPPMSLPSSSVTRSSIPADAALFSDLPGQTWRYADDRQTRPETDRRRRQR